jgi:NADH-quinone oxidoreductase subunit I
MAVLSQAAKSLVLWELLSGWSLTWRYMFRQKATINYPYEKGPLSPRFRGEHALRRYPNGEERCIACKLCEAVCPAHGDHDRGGAARRRQPAHDPLRHRHDEVHLLRLLPGGVPGRRHRRGAELRVRHETREELFYNKDKLLENGDRWEARSPATWLPTRPIGEPPMIVQGDSLLRVRRRVQSAPASWSSPRATRCIRSCS